MTTLHIGAATAARIEETYEPASGMLRLSVHSWLLMPARFGRPFACRIESKGSGFVPRFV